MAILAATAVNEDGYREVLGAAEGMKGWISFFQRLRGRGLNGVKLIVGDKCLGMLEAVEEVFPDAKYQRGTVYFYRNVFSIVPRSKVKLVAKMFKAIHGSAKRRLAKRQRLWRRRCHETEGGCPKGRDGIAETLTSCDFPGEHWTHIRTNNVMERLNQEIRRRTRGG